MGKPSDILFGFEVVYHVALHEVYGHVHTGDTAVFSYEVPQATFVPASITSLGRTTLPRTVSYLVLERPASNITEFLCSFQSTSQATSCAGSSEMTSSLDLNSVSVELDTTNITFEVCLLVDSVTL